MKLDQWIEERKGSVLLAIMGLTLAGWLWAYLTIPYPAVFGDEFNTYAVTRAKSDPTYNLADFDWVFRLRGSMLLFASAYQNVHSRSGNPLAMAQFFNALWLTASVPLVWVVARSLLLPTLSLFCVVLYILAPSHLLGGYFILEPMFYFGFWAVLATTLLALGGNWWWSLTAGTACALLCNVKPHGLITSAWSLAFLILSGFFLGGTPADKGRRLRALWWLAGFVIVQLLFRWTSGGASTDTVRGEGFYGSVFQQLTQPTVVWNLLKSAWGAFQLHMGLYGMVYSLSAGLVLAGLFDLPRIRSRLRPLCPADLFALSIPTLGCGLLCMTFAFSSLVDQTARVHGRYWSYMLIPALLSGLYLTTKPLVTRKAWVRSFPLLIILIAGWFGLFRIREGLQIAANDCPEIFWMYLGIWRPEWERVVVKGIVAAGLVASIWFLIRPRSGLVACLGLLLVASITGDYFGLQTIRKNSVANGVQNRMGVVLQSYESKLSEKSMLIVAPGAFMAGGAMFGLSRIPVIWEKPAGSILTPNEVTAQFQVVGTIENFILPADFVRIWSEVNYSIYVRGPLPAAASP